jgi:hypothetical protein
MANTFKNYVSASVGTSAITVYTVPSSTTSVVIGLNVANRGAAQITVDVQLGSTYIIKSVPIPVASSLSVLDGKIIMETTETLVVTSSAASSADVILSVLEQS